MYLFCCANSPTYLFKAINRQRFSFNSLQTGVVFPGPGVTLPSFRKLENLPQIRLPRAFLSAARGIEVPSGRLTMALIIILVLHLFTIYLCMIN